MSRFAREAKFVLTLAVTCTVLIMLLVVQIREAGALEAGRNDFGES